MAELEISREKTSVDDRLMVMLTLAALFHLIVILGVSFSAAGRDGDGPPPTLEVLLVSDALPAAAKNDDARYLAQRTQEGAGNIRDAGRSQMPRAGNAPIDQAGGLEGTVSPDADLGAAGGDQQSVIAANDPSRAGTEGDAPQAAMPGAQDLPRQLVAGADSTLPSAEDDPELRLKGAAKRELMVTPSTRESDVAVYLDAWKHKVERVGTLNFPNQARRRGMTGDPVVEVVLGADGRMLDAAVRRSSGYPELDQAALEILRLAAPFEPFPRELAARHDAIRFVYEWQFVGGQLTGSSVRASSNNR